MLVTYVMLSCALLLRHSFAMHCLTMCAVLPCWPLLSSCLVSLSFAIHSLSTLGRAGRTLENAHNNLVLIILCAGVRACGRAGVRACWRAGVFPVMASRSIVAASLDCGARAAKLYSLLCQSLTRYGTFVLLCAFPAVLFWLCYTVLL